MKKTQFVISLLSASLLFAGLTACKGGEEPVPFSFSASLVNSEGNTVKNIKAGETATIETTEFEASDVKEGEEVEHSYVYTSSDPTVLTVDEEGNVTALKSGKATIIITEEIEDVGRSLFVTVYDKDPLTGAVSYSDSVEKKTEIIGALEEYAMDKHLTGVSLFEDGGYVMYNPRIQKGTEEYISGYGFGILTEGNITSDLASENKTEWKRYYHSASASDPHNINDLNSNGSEVSDLADYMVAALYSTKMNADKSGYEWYPMLANDHRPILCDAEGNALADQSGTSKYIKIHVKTGANGGVKYRTNSTVTGLKEFDGSDVTIEDYLYAYKFLLTKSFGQFRGSELAADTDYGIVGAKDYYDRTGEATGVNDELFKSVGISAGHDEQGDYLFYNLLKAKSSFYAMYGLSSSLYRPLSKDFVKALGDGDELEGSKNLATFVDGKNWKPVDTTLSLGAYALEYWEEDKAIVFKKVNNWWGNQISGCENLYRIPGVKISVMAGAKNDNTLVFKEFLKGNVDAAGIPTVAYVKKYKNDPRTTVTKGSSVFKLNVNSCTPEQWEEKFGVNGTITKTSKSSYWNVKPWMSNDSFLQGIETAIDRQTFAENRGSIPSNNYFSSNYLSDPENGVSYNTTKAHEEAIKGHYPDTYGYNLEASKVFFRQAVNELVEAGDLELGTKSKPTEISIDIWWMFESNIKDYGDEISKYIESAFNSSYVSGGKVKLKVNNFAVAEWSDVYYKHLLVGQFDLGFGSVSGNSLDPLNFLEVLRSDNSSTFTLNWGPDTSKVDDDLIFDGRAWSYDGLWAAGNSYAYLKNGEESGVFDLTAFNFEALADGSWKFTVTTLSFTQVDVVSMLYGLCLFGTTDSTSYSDYYEMYVTIEGASDSVGNGYDDPNSYIKELSSTNANGVVTSSFEIVFSANLVNAFKAAFKDVSGAQVAPVIYGVDVYYLFQYPQIGIGPEEAIFGSKAFDAPFGNVNP